MKLLRLGDSRARAPTLLAEFHDAQIYLMSTISADPAKRRPLLPDPRSYVYLLWYISEAMLEGSLSKYSYISRQMI